MRNTAAGAPEVSELTTYTRASAFAILGFMVVMTLSLELARLPLVVMVDPVRQSFGLSDVQVSLLLGVFASVPFLVMSLVGGWLSDRFSRRLLLSGAALAWFIGALLCATAERFETLIAGRALIGAGAGMKLPIAMTWINDAFPARERGRAIGAFFVVLGSGPSLAVMLAGTTQRLAESGGLPMFALLGDGEPWRTTIAALALPTLLFLPLAFLLTDRRSTSASVSKTSEPGTASLHIPLSLVGLIVAGAALAAFIDAANLSWIPTIFIRDLEFDAQQAGLVLGVATLIAGAAGPLIGGWLGDALFVRHGIEGRVWLASLAAFLCVPLLMVYLLATPVPMIVALVLSGVCTVSALSLSYVTIQAVLPPGKRGLGTGIVSACTTLIGSFGPTAVALLSDRLSSKGDALAIALVTVAGSAAFLAGVVLLSCAAILRRRRSVKGLGSEPQTGAS